MRKFTLLLIILCFSSLHTLAQSQVQYGALLKFNTAQFSPDIEGLKNNPGFGGGIFIDVPIYKQFGLATDITYELYRFFSESQQSNVYFDVVQPALGIKYKINDQWSISAQSMFGVYWRHDIFLGFDSSVVNIHSPLVRDFGYKVTGTVMLNEYSSLGITLSRRPNLRLNALTIAYNFDFTAVKVSTSKRKKAALELAKLEIDTLYVVNKSCTDSMTDDRLDSLFRQHYNFSQYKIISVDQIDSVKTNHKPMFFALVGRHYASLDEPITDGIFLMDNDFELTEFPYPVHTSYYPSFARSEPCFESVYNSARTIKEFNARLFRRL